MRPTPELSIVVPVVSNMDDLPRVLRHLEEALSELKIASEIVITTDSRHEPLVRAAAGSYAVVVSRNGQGYGGALRAGLAAALGEWVMTVDAEVTDPAAGVRDLWRARGRADVLVGSRYVEGGADDVPVGRRAASRLLSAVFEHGLNVPVRDVSSGLRLYRSSVFRTAGLPTQRARGIDAQEEILVRALNEGYTVAEVPFSFHPEHPHGAYRRTKDAGLSSLRTFWSLWSMRNSILAADYDDRAHDSRIPLQRYWQRQRFRHVTDLFAGEGRVLDVGCGSSRILSRLPAGSVGVDILMRKLRYARQLMPRLVAASGFALPFPDASFPCVVCSQVIEHVPKDSPILSELMRVLAPGGRLVLGTPDYARWEWVITEKLYGFFAPGGYADEHIGHYTRAELIDFFERRGYRHEDTRYILRGELILAFRKPARSGEGPAVPAG
jgi:dolichol-phosphate mannosyltransferase